MISEIYLQNMTTRFQNVLDVVSCADVYALAAEKRAQQYGIKAVSVDDMLADKEIEIIVNLTIPAAHYEISKKILFAGKHAYSEKPLADTYEKGKELLEIAKDKDLTVAAAPDTFLGAGLQTCIDLLDSGAIGTPVGVQAFMLSSGPESFHPNPEFFYKEGAGPLFDMGPYYLTALAAMFGPAVRVTGLASALTKTRNIQNPESPYYPGTFETQVETYISSGIEFRNGVIANVTTAWEMPFPYWEANLPLMTVFGTEGTLVVPDPNTFGGIGTIPVSTEIGRYVLLKRGAGDFEEIPLKYDHADNSRGIGVADLARAIQTDGKPRVSGAMSLHVLELMEGTLQAAKTGKHHEMESTFERPRLLEER